MVGTYLREDLPVTATYFRALSSRCRTAAQECLDLFAKEEFRRLASEFEARASELEPTANKERFLSWIHLVPGAYRQNGR